MILYLSIISFFVINLYQVIARKFNKTVFIISLSTAFWLITLPTYSFGTDFLTIISKFLLSLIKLTDLFSFGVDVQELIDNLPTSFNTNYLYFWMVFLYSCSSFLTLSFLFSLFSHFFNFRVCLDFIFSRFASFTLNLIITSVPFPSSLDISIFPLFLFNISLTIESPKTCTTTLSHSWTIYPIKSFKYLI